MNKTVIFRGCRFKNRNEAVKAPFLRYLGAEVEYAPAYLGGGGLVITNGRNTHV